MPNKILIAEDNETNQIVLEAILESLNFTCEVCSNGNNAARVFLANLNSGKNFTAIFMDCQMPIQDGFTTTQLIRQHESLQKTSKRTPIIAITAHTEAGYQKKCIDSGMDAYISKPFTVQSIRNVLSDLQLMQQEHS
jgi:CheY-like chemotaxis protein